MAKKNSPIGIFDSGLGGLTIVKTVQKALPNEDIIYFGDTARVPYGIKSEETIQNYTQKITNFLIKKEVKLIIIACNTVSATARRVVEKTAVEIPVLDVITIGAHSAVKFKNHSHIGVIGTLATIASGAYDREIQARSSSVTVTSRACPLLVPLAEEGWVDNHIAKQILTQYLKNLEGANIDSLVLGCTHYPLFKSLIKKVLHRPSIGVIDPSDAVAEAAKRKLEKAGMLNDGNAPSFECYVSDRPQRYYELAERFLGKEIEEIHVVRLD